VDAELDDALRRWLKDLHAVERQAAVALRVARRVVGDPELIAELDDHLAQTEAHRAEVERQLRARAAGISRARDAAATLNRMGFVLYTTLTPDTPGKLLADSFAYENFEIAAYRMLAHAARRAGEEALRRSALEICAEEEAMADRVAGRFDWAVARIDRSGPAAGGIVGHLRAADALEAQASVLLRLGRRVMRSPPLRRYLLEQHRCTDAQRARLAARLAELGGRPSQLRVGVMRAAGAAWALAWGAQRHAPAKLACFLYSERHLQMAGYALLRREAAREGDRATEALAADLFEQERMAAASLAELLTLAADEALAGGGWLESAASG
jgi:ferritin-like metal-binding protein YciE